MSENREETESREMLLRRAAFGKQVEQFLQSDVGRYLTARADEEVNAAFAEFKSADPRDGKNLEKIQNKIFRAESFKGWLADAVMDGVTAFNVLTDREE